ncbi:MAG: FAD-dependent monooxygenase [Actinomycetota bacterium]|nr:FAD-dependent monooxygenase [Actinomycetota bacterium]
MFTRGEAPKPRAHAVVVGAGVSGLLSARVLSGRFERVTLVERDALPEEAVARKGVPQARHLHSLAARGSQILEDLFPGFDAELAAAGCPLLDQASDAVTQLAAGRLPRFRSGITMRAASRALVERRIRARLERDPGIAFLPGREAAGLLPGPKGVRGVRTRLRVDGSTEEVAADLVVDASGAGSRAPRWLEEIGYEAPEETVVDARLGYATRWYRVPEGFSGDWTGVAVLPGWPETTRGGTLRRVEGDLWTAVLIGTGGDYPPTDPEEFVEFAASLHSPAIHDAIKDAEPASPVYGYRRTANRLRHYEKTRLPGNFLIAGDAACVLNPSYGQGMTAAALSALALRECLDGERGANLSRSFQRRQRRAIAPCWTATTNSDAQWAAGGVEDLNFPRRILYRISEEVMKLAVEREDVARTMLGVKNVIEPPAALLRPGILLPALARTIKQRKAKPAPTEGKLIADR